MYVGTEGLDEGSVLCHPFVIGELACGNLKNRGEILSLLEALPASTVASHQEVLHLLSEQKLHGKGLGWIRHASACVCPSVEKPALDDR